MEDIVSPSKTQASSEVKERPNGGNPALDMSGMFLKSETAQRKEQDQPPEVNSDRSTTPNDHTS